MKTYINGNFINEYVFNDGGSILKISIPANSFDQFIQELRAAKTENGLKLQITKRKTPAVNQKTGKPYATHCLSVDDYVPKQAAPPTDDPFA